MGLQTREIAQKSAEEKIYCAEGAKKILSIFKIKLTKFYAMHCPECSLIIILYQNILFEGLRFSFLDVFFYSLPLVFKLFVFHFPVLSFPFRPFTRFPFLLSLLAVFPFFPFSKFSSFLFYISFFFPVLSSTLLAFSSFFAFPSRSLILFSRLFLAK